MVDQRSQRLCLLACAPQTQPGSCCRLCQRGDNPAVLPNHTQGWVRALDCQADDEKADFGRQVEGESWGTCHPVTAAWGSFLTGTSVLSAQKDHVLQVLGWWVLGKETDQHHSLANISAPQSVEVPLI